MSAIRPSDAKNKAFTGYAISTVENKAVKGIMAIPVAAGVTLGCCGVNVLKAKDRGQNRLPFALTRVASAVVSVKALRFASMNAQSARALWVWQVILAHLWQLTLAHLWQLAGQGRGMEMRCAPGWSVAKARSTARASISPWSWVYLSRRIAGSGSCRRRFR